MGTISAFSFIFSKKLEVAGGFKNQAKTRERDSRRRVLPTEFEIEPFPPNGRILS